MSTPKGTLVNVIPSLRYQGAPKAMRRSALAPLRRMHDRGRLDPQPSQGTSKRAW